MHPLMPAVLVGAGGLDELGPNAEPEPPDGELAEAVERVRGREGHAVNRCHPAQSSVVRRLQGPVLAAQSALLLSVNHQRLREPLPARV